MPAPRLLDKKTLVAELATQRKRDVDAGIKIAQKVDAVREALAEEERKLELFRKETIARIQGEIDAKMAEKEAIVQDTERRREEWRQAQAPIDLKIEWAKVAEDKRELASWNTKLSEQQIRQLANESDEDSRRHSLDAREHNIKVKESLTERTLTDAEVKFIQADETLEAAEKRLANVNEEAKRREAHLSVREQDATLREERLSKREETVDAHDIDLSNREIKLKSRQELFIKAKNYLKAKQ